MRGISEEGLVLLYVRILLEFDLVRSFFFRSFRRKRRKGKKKLKSHFVDGSWCWFTSRKQMLFDPSDISSLSDRAMRWVMIIAVEYDEGEVEESR